MACGTAGFSPDARAAEKGLPARHPRRTAGGGTGGGVPVGVSRRGHRPKRVGGLSASIPGLGLAAAHPLWRGGGWPRRLPGQQPGSGNRRQRDSPPEGRIVPAALTTLATHPPRQVLWWGVRDWEWAGTGTGGPYRADGRCGWGCRGGMAQGDAARTPNINCRGSRGGIGRGVQCKCPRDIELPAAGCTRGSSCMQRSLPNE
jgi:hypothetical protein